MSTNTITQFMALTNPTVGQEPGPAYATDISGDLVIIDAHDHNTVGVKLGSAALNLTSDLSLQSNNLTNLRSTRFTAQGATLSGSGDTNCLYSVSGNLYFNNGSGTPIELTSGSAINFANQVNYATISVSNVNHTINFGDVVSALLVSTTSSPVILTLPSVSAVPGGRAYIVSDAGNQAAINNITVNPAGTDTINGLSTYKIFENNASILVYSDGVSNWQLLPFNRKTYNNETISLTNSSHLTADSSSTVSLSGSLSANTLSVTSTSALTGELDLGAYVKFLSAVGTPTIYQDKLSTSSGVGQTLTLQAQNAIGATSTGGNLVLTSGSGTSSDGYVLIQEGGNSVAQFLSYGQTNYKQTLQFSSSVTSPIVKQATNTTNSATGQALTLQAQNCTGTTTIGGSLFLNAGTGTNVNGAVWIQNGATTNTIFENNNMTLFVPSVLFDSGVSSPVLQQNTATSDVAVSNLSIIAQAPYASASSHKDAGQINLTVPNPVSGGARGQVNVVDGSTTIITMSGDASHNATIAGNNLTLHSSGTLTVGGLSTVISGAALGFYGSAGTAKPTITGSRGSNAALASLLTALAAMNLLTDSSS